VGGWNNTLDGLEQMVAGNKTTLATVPQTPLADNTWYDIRIVINGARVQCYLNDVLKQDHTFTTTASLFTSAIYNQADQQIVTKLVNPYGVSLATTFNVAGVPTVASNATLIQLTSASPSDENTLDYPTNVFPVTSVVTNAGTNFTLTLPAYSLSVLRLQLPSPLPPNGLTAVAAGAQVGLSWPPYAGATNYVLKRATNSGGPYTVLATTTGTTYSDTNVVLGGVQYYYVLAAELSSGPTPDSTEASAITPPPPSSYVWGGANSIWTDTSLPGWNGGPPISGDSVTITNGVVALTTGNQPGGVAVTVGGSGVLRSAGYYLTPGSLTFTNGGTVSLENTSQYHSYGGGWLPTTVTVTGASAAGSFLTGDASIAFWNQSPVTTFNVADVTGNANADLTVSAGLKDGVYSGNDNLWTPAAVVKTGAGTLKLTAINTYIGGTTVNEGTLELSGAAGGNGLIRGAVTVNSGATLALTGGDGTGFGWNNAISSLTVNGGTVNTPGGMHIGFGSTVVTLTNGAVITGGTNQWNGDGLLTFSSTGDSQNTISSALVLRSDAGTNHTFNVADGAAATDLLISGNLSDLYPEIGWLSPAALVKTGDGTLALNGANTYDGVTTVSAGTLGGTGSIQGPVIVQSGAALSPGTSLGTLTISNTLTLQAGSQTFVELNAATGTNDLLRGVTTVNYDGTLVVSNVAGNVSAGQTFQLFSAANRTGNFSAVTGVPGVTWSFNPTNGMLTAITAVSLNPTNLTASVSGTNLTLNWPGDHTGWTLIQQTNRLDSGVSVNMNDWMRVPNSSATNQVVIPILPDASGGYYRLVYP
jgi:autotransporter-associated beta strand protein